MDNSKLIRLEHYEISELKVTANIHPAVQDANDFNTVAVIAKINDVRSNEVL